MQKIDFNKCTPEFFEKNLCKINVEQFDEYNAWLGICWTLKSLGLSKNTVIDFCSGSSKFELKAVENVYNNPNKGKDNFEQACLKFAKYAHIKLPEIQKEFKEYNQEEFPETTTWNSYVFHKVDIPYKKQNIIFSNDEKFDEIEKIFSKMYGKDDITFIDNDEHLHKDKDGNFYWLEGPISEILSAIKNSIVKQNTHFISENGCKFKINTMSKAKLKIDQTRGIKNIKEYNYTLIESDRDDILNEDGSINEENLKQSLDWQYSMVKLLKLPYTYICYSGGKSIHTIVKINAGKSLKEFNKRVNFIHGFCKANGFDIDNACKNADREARFPGVYRKKYGKWRLQELIETEESSEFKTFEEWYEWAKKYTELNVDALVGGNYNLIDSLDYDRYEDIFIEGQHIFYKFKNEDIKQTNSNLLWMEVKHHIKKDIVKTILSNKETPSISINDFFIPTKTIVYKPQPSILNSEYEYNSFKPGLIDNLNRDFSIKELPSEFEKLLNNLAGEEEKKWFINHLAADLQLFMSGYSSEHKKPQTIPILYGKQGIGKNTIMERYAEIKGALATNGNSINDHKTALKEVDKNMMDSSFNDWKESHTILLNEMNKDSIDKRDFSASIKLLTSPSYSINKKFMPVIEVKNCSYIVIAGNKNVHGILNVEQDDRRFQFITGGKEKIKDVFNEVELIKQTPDFANFLLNYEVDWKLANTVFDNDEKLNQKELSLDDYEKTLKMFIEEYPEREYISAGEFTDYGKNCDCNVLKKKASIFLKNKFGEPKKSRKQNLFNNEIINTQYYKLKKEI